MRLIISSWGGGGGRRKYESWFGVQEFSNAENIGAIVK